MVEPFPGFTEKVLWIRYLSDLLVQIHFTPTIKFLISVKTYFMYDEHRNMTK